MVNESRSPDGDKPTDAATVSVGQRATYEPDNDIAQELFEGWTPEFTVWLVRRGETWPMEVDCIFLDEAGARKRAELRGSDWRAVMYSGLVPPANPPSVSAKPPFELREPCSSFESHPVCVMLCARCLRRYDEHVKASAALPEARPAPPTEPQV